MSRTAGKNRKKGGFCIALGLLLIAAALGLCARNVYQSLRAAQVNREVLEALAVQMPEQIIPVDAPGGLPENPEIPENRDAPALPGETESGGNGSYAFYAVAGGGSAGEIMYPDYVTAPRGEMPTLSINSEKYIGVIAFPDYGKSWPVETWWNSEGFACSPGRYTGSAYTDDMVIAGHNDGAIFGWLSRVREGDRLTFTDIEGDQFAYEVIAVEIVGPYDYAEMVTGDWDLTLFTCTKDPPPRHRLTIRCRRLR